MNAAFSAYEYWESYAARELYFAIKGSARAWKAYHKAICGLLQIDNNRWNLNWATTGYWKHCRARAFFLRSPDWRNAKDINNIINLPIWHIAEVNAIQWKDYAEDWEAYIDNMSNMRINDSLSLPEVVAKARKAATAAKVYAETAKPQRQASP